MTEIRPSWVASRGRGLRGCARRVGWLGCLVALAGAAVMQGGSLTGPELFAGDRVWTLHLRFSADQWEAMEPKRDNPGFGFPFGGGGGPGREPKPEDFGPGMFLGPGVMQAADGNHDGTISKAEFSALADRWFSAWDQGRKGQLTQEEVRKGLNASLGGGGAGPRPGGGGGPGMMLQGREGQRNGLASSLGVEFKYVVAQLEFEGESFKDVEVRYKGNGTWMQSQGGLKRSMKIDLNRRVKGQALGGVTTLNLHNCVTDASWMNEVLSHRLFRDAGVPAPRTAYARVYVTVPGLHDRGYFGLYSLVENIDSNFMEDRFGTRKGALLKPVTPEPFTDLGDDWDKYQQTYDPKTELKDAQARRVMAFCKLVSHADDSEFAASVGDYLNLEEVARFLAATVWLSTMDSILGPGQNYYVYLSPKTGRMQLMPWDLDHSFGQFPMIGSQEQREQLSIERPWQGERRFLERLFKVAAFQTHYRAQLRAIGEKLWRPDRIAQQVDALAKAIRPAVQEEGTGKLERFDKVVAGEGVPPEMPGDVVAPRSRAGERRGPQPGAAPGPVRMGGFPGFMPAVKPIKGFVRPRAESVMAQLDGRSEGQTPAGFGFGGPGGGRGGGPRAGRGPGEGGPAPVDFGPGTFLGEEMFKKLDTDKDGVVKRPEFDAGFGRWLEAWDVDKNGSVSEEELRRGMNRDLAPFRGGPPGGPGFGFPGPGPAPFE